MVDVGKVIELYAEFSRTGATYVPYPDPRSHRIRLSDLADDAIRARLRAVWRDPLSLDPTRQSAKVTREIEAHREFPLTACRLDPALLARAEPRIRRLFEPLPEIDSAWLVRWSSGDPDSA